MTGVNAELFEVTIGWNVSGHDPVHAFNNPDGPLFVPGYVKVLISDGGPPHIVVGGPELNRQGKPLKRNAYTSYDHDQLDEAPPWLAELLASVPWVRQLIADGDRRELIR